MASVTIAPSRLALMASALMLAELVSSLEASMIYVALPSISRQFGDLVGAGWLITAFLLAQAVMAAIGGRLGDMFGRRRVLFALLGCCAIGSAISAFSTDLLWVIVGRAIQGSSGGILPLCIGILRENAPAPRLPFWIAVVTVAYAFGGGIGFVLGGALTDGGHWRAIFHVTFFLPFVAAAAIWLFVPGTAPERSARGVDWISVIFFTAGIAGILFLVSRGGQWGWTSSQLLSSLAASLVALTIWVRHSLRTADPLIDVRLFRNRAFVTANIVFIGFGLGAMQLAVIMMMLFQQPVATGVGMGVSAVLAGWLKLPSNVISMIAGPTAGALASRSGARAAIVRGCLLGTITWAALAFYHESLTFVVLATLCAAFSATMILAATPSAVVAVVPLDRTSEATGVTYVVRAVATAIGTQIVTALLAAYTVVDAAGAVHPSPLSYRLAFAFVALMTLVALLGALALPREAAAGTRADGAGPEPAA